MRTFILHNKPTVAIVIFLILFSTMHMIKPSFIYETDGSFRKFGVGYTHKTVVPAWIISIVLGIVSYLGVLYFLAHY
jgi:uncharacterized membrane protein YozB (DUF420 family)